MIKFEIGKTYATRSVCDHDCMFTIEVIKRTDKTITYKEDDTVRRAKIRFSDDYEYIRVGNYSMAPNFSAKGLVIEDKENESNTEKYFVISRYYDNGKTIAFIEMNSTKYKTEYIRNFDQYVDEFSTLEEAEECLQECLSA
ncbi:hypothetical protein CDIF28670_01076 [Clostridioides difficile]|uniref:hypothetical protein n=1 Tax=Clostridioides difficile TaxID=1496 RepID=UPI000E882659|nr:hypothetical protein [Clostridioides difficile]AXU74686.1 hypothetical protein CDIF28670_01076 [Clostridioides difficile]MDV9592760.1 hypothetical protein [Clostridioides difficile]MDW0089099.1 hypothetical protein [Clostridioides difficile]MDW0089130.1 hypothetical protein [Clostridioides difficile]MDW0089390.1 hypothetical protein [Clostridioides difficile]